MAALRPNSNASFLAERLYGASLGLIVGALLLGDIAQPRTVVVIALGFACLLGSIATNIVVKRKTIVRNRAENQNNLLKAVQKS